MIELAYAPNAWKLLNGFFCIYKPPGIPRVHLQNTIAFNLCRDLNAMEKRAPRDLVLLKGSVASRNPFEVELVPNYADHELVVGLRYQVQDIRMKWFSFLGRNTSGVLVLAVNDGCKKLTTVDQTNFLRTYEIKGQFGLASTTFMLDGKIIAKSTYTHIRQNTLERLLASIQASHQALAYQYSGVDLQSQEAYELASKGIVRPAGKSNPIIYGMKCIEFNLPYFTIEIQCINETEAYLTELVHQLGVYLRSSAICTQLRQVQFGHFTLDYALLQKHWNLENILNNITLSKSIFNNEEILPSSPNFKLVKISDLKMAMENMQNRIREENL